MVPSSSVKTLLEIGSKTFTLNNYTLKLAIPHSQILFELIKRYKGENLTHLLHSSLNDALLMKTDDSLLLLLSFLYPQSTVHQMINEQKQSMSAVHVAVGMGYTKGLE